MHIVEIKNLKKKYRRFLAIKDLSLCIDEGEVYGLLGPNGSGKTTVLRSMLGLIFINGGSIKLFGKDAEDPGTRNEVGYLPGDFRMDPKIRTRSLLQMYVEARGGRGKEYSEELIELLRLDTKKRFGELSKGNRQKIGVIQAFMHNPKLLVLDESTSGLDPILQSRVLKLVTQARDNGAAVLFSSHSLDETQRVSNRVGMIKSGDLVFDDTLANINREENGLEKAFFKAFEDGDY